MGRRPDGLGHEKKLSDKDIAEIRRLFKKKCPVCGNKEWTQKKIAEKFGVSPTLIHWVIQRKRHFK